MHNYVTCELINGYSEPIYFAGPSLEEGPLPALFYFAHTGQESLTLDPYSQPVVFLADQKIRIYSLLLPEHTSAQESAPALAQWAKHIQAGNNFVSEFVNICVGAIDFLITAGYIDETKIAVSGLSRGAFIASHLAAVDTRIKTILGFAPLTNLETIAAFKDLQHPLTHHLALTTLVENLADKTLRFYVGNRDMSVGTDTCFAFIHALTEAAYLHKNRSPPVELVIYPSIGHRGHGTPPHIFRDGADWVSRQL